MAGMSMDSQRTATVAATGGVLRAAVATGTVLRVRHGRKTSCGRAMRTPGTTASRNTPPAAEAAPPSRRGEVAYARSSHRMLPHMQQTHQPLSHIFSEVQLDFVPPSSVIPRMQGSRNATELSPLREGGGAAMTGMSMAGKRQATEAATGGVLRVAVAAWATLHQPFCGWGMRKHAPTAPRNTPPAAEAAPPFRRGAGACARTVRREMARKRRLPQSLLTHQPHSRSRLPRPQ